MKFNLIQKYNRIRKRSEDICTTLKTEDYVVQPAPEVSPPKWHLGHTTWFFETFVLIPHSFGYELFDPGFNFVFNSYYENLGARVIRTDRGNLSRPTVDEIYKYRSYVDKAIAHLLKSVVEEQVIELITLGLNHEQQHQELLLTDIKFILGNNPLFPVFDPHFKESHFLPIEDEAMLEIHSGIYEIGHTGKGFCFDNEMGRHKVFLADFSISKTLVTNAQFIDFIENGGYELSDYWHSEGWDWKKNNGINTPLYWHNINGEWVSYTLAGIKPIHLSDPVTHISYYEAYAFASWKGMRLPTEFEWEVAARIFSWGERWEWTESAYLPYPGFKKAPGAIGEYNGKFMVNQMILRGASIATPQEHERISYRNFFHPQYRWQYTGIRLAK